MEEQNKMLMDGLVRKQLEQLAAMSPADENYNRLMELCRKNAEVLMADEKFRAELMQEQAKLVQEAELAKKNRRAENMRTAITVGVPVVAGGVATGFLAYLELTGKMLTGAVVKEGVKKFFMKLFGR